VQMLSVRGGQAKDLQLRRETSRRLGVSTQWCAVAWAEAVPRLVPVTSGTAAVAYSGY
jgi:hypothetical protein